MMITFLIILNCLLVFSVIHWGKCVKKLIKDVEELDTRIKLMDKNYREYLSLYMDFTQEFHEHMHKYEFKDGVLYIQEPIINTQNEESND